MITVVTSERFDSDPRCDQVVSSLLTKFDEVEILDIQTLRPSVREILGCLGSTVVRRRNSDAPHQFSTWTSKRAAIKLFEKALLAEPRIFPELAQIVLSKALNTPEAYLLNRLALSYASLHCHLSSLILSHEDERVILAEDFPSAVAALLLKNTFGIRVLYDAHEMYVEAISLMNPGVTDTLLDLLRSTEVNVWQSVDVLATVSPGIAHIISEVAQNREVLVVPNFSSITRAIDGPLHVTSGRPRFAYFGGAAPHRNVDVLADNWPSGPDQPTLSLYMPSSPWAREVERIAAANPNLLICQPVAPGDLVATMSQYDFGVIPYAYPFPYSHASPNKFGEYLAAGLPILAHSQHFTSSLINQHQLGLVCDFTSPSELSAALQSMRHMNGPSFRTHILNTFRQQLNWENVVQPLITAVSGLSSSARAGFFYASPAWELKESRWPRHTLLTDYMIDSARPLITRLYRSRFTRFLTRCVPSRVLRRIA